MQRRDGTRQLCNDGDDDDSVIDAVEIFSLLMKNDVGLRIIMHVMPGVLHSDCLQKYLALYDFLQRKKYF